MFNTADIVVLVILLIGSYIGYKKGFLRMGFDFGSYIASWFIAVWGYKYFSKLIIQSPIIKNTIDSFVSKNIIVDDKISPIVPEVFKNAIGQTTSNLNKSLQDAATVVLINFIAIVVTFILAKIAIMIIKNILGILRTVPIIGTIDGFIGFVMGLFIALILVYIGLSIIYFFPNAESFKTALRYIKQSMFVEYLYENNIIIMLMKKYLSLKI